MELFFEICIYANKTVAMREFVNYAAKDDLRIMN